LLCLFKQFSNSTLEFSAHLSVKWRTIHDFEGYC
jgi:hypothetical protein